MTFSFLQIEAADKQLKATRQFLEDQATEREQERDEFSKEIEKLRVIVKEKDKDITTHENHQKEVKEFIQIIICRLHTPASNARSFDPSSLILQNSFSFFPFHKKLFMLRTKFAC